MIDPDQPYKDDGQEAKLVRLQTLLEFLEESDDSVRVAMTPAARRENVLVVGDWFCCHSMAPSPGVGYYQTIFTWHAPRVLFEIEQFDRMFANYHNNDSGSSRERAIARISEIIDEIRRRSDQRPC